LRQEWAAAIDAASLAWHQKAKVRDGASSTLLWLEMTPNEPNRGDAPLVYTCRAVGDCCLFHLRGAKVLRSFPMERSDAFTTSPRSLCSVRRREDGLVIGLHTGECRPGDMLVLSTDALAEWILARLEEGWHPPFLEWWEMRPDRFVDWLAPLREAKTIRPDDTTVVLLKVAGGE
jgi:hypothetical protein